MMALPTWTSLAPCSLSSSTLRAGYAGGMAAMLDDSCARRRCKPQVEAGKGSPSIEQRNTRGQILVSSPDQFLMSLDTSALTQSDGP
jgi:hypothetical protein